MLTVSEDLKHLKAVTEHYLKTNRATMGYGEIYHLEMVIEIYNRRITKMEGKGILNGGN